MEKNTEPTIFFRFKEDLVFCWGVGGCGVRLLAFRACTIWDGGKETTDDLGLMG